MRVLVTGSNGFVGTALVRRLVADGVVVRAAVRGGTARGQPGAEIVRVGDLAPHTDWSDALRGVDAIVHAAARVHVMRERASSPLDEFRRVNVAGTEALAQQAARAGVRRFVFISSIKVNGEATEPGRPYTADDQPVPADPYGVSKREAEDILRAIERDTGMEVVVVRPVLIYGPGVKGNFLTLLRWISRGVPLPLGAIRNRRSVVALDNLVDLVAVTLTHPRAPGQTFLVSDGEDLSTTELLRRVGDAMDVRARLLPVPVPLIRWTAALLGRRAFADRLCGSLQVDITRTRTLLGWTPPVPIDAALAATARHFRGIDGR